ncbi:hypothetical protein AL496_016555 [Enterococcus faecium]|nr:hypothetical protein AL496_016555 [Enterococcus faecium]
MNPFLFLQIGVDTRIMRVLNYYCKRNNKESRLTHHVYQYICLLAPDQCLHYQEFRNHCRTIL